MKTTLYKAYSPNLSFSNFDHIVVGSGMGGLTVATWLAKAGKKVAVFERHSKPGGFTHTFKRGNGFQWDVGVHYVGNVGKDGSLRSLFDFLTNHKLDWEPIGDIYDVVYIDRKRYEFKAGIENFRKQITDYFPDEENAIDTYLKLVNKANQRANAFFVEKAFKPFLSFFIGWIIRKRYAKYYQKTTLEVLSKLTNNKQLIAVLCAQFGNYGLTPKYSSFAAHALVIGHFIEGGYYPKGGADQICFKTIETLASNGGELYTDADVQEIVVKNKQVQGIIIHDKFINCLSVISNVGVYNTFNQLISTDTKQLANFNLRDIKLSKGHLCLYLGLDKSDSELNLPKYNIWKFASNDLDEISDKVTLSDAPDKFIYISFPSAKDPCWPEKHPHTATIQAITIGSYDWFSKYKNLPYMNRGNEYMGIKKAFKAAMLKQLYELLPQIKGHVVTSEVSSPLSTKHFCNYQEGEIYGLEHSPARFTLPFLRPETKIKGLRLVGQDITIVGIGGAMLSGVLCAVTILKFKVSKLFMEIARNK